MIIVIIYFNLTICGKNGQEDRINMSKIPIKIKNLYLLQDLGVQVPFFVFIDSEKKKNINDGINKIKEEFKNKNIKSVIIRSASFKEDLDEKSMAGFFESSKEILLEDLSVEKIKYFWEKNKTKAENNNLGEFFVFIQEYFSSDYSGVLFTEDTYDKDRAIIALSLSDHAITDGLSADKKIIFDKKNDSWEGVNFLKQEILSELRKLILKSKEKFINGADIEFGVKGNKINFYQIRPITRNDNEKILLQEKKRLKDKFGSDFEAQLWGKNGFVEALGDLTPLFLSLYNCLLNSKELKSLLKEAQVIDEVSNNTFPILENIGGRTSFNFSQGMDEYVDAENYFEHIDPNDLGGEDISFGNYQKAESLVPSAIDWLEENKEEKFFLLLQGFDTHCPFTPNEEYAKKFTGGKKSDIEFVNYLWTFGPSEVSHENGKKHWNVKSSYSADGGLGNIKMTKEDIDYMLALYDSEIAQADNALGELLLKVREMDLEKNTIVIFMSEHGDLFGEHGRFMRGGPLRGTFYNQVLNFPFAIKHPKVKERKEIGNLIQTVDVMPTLVDILRLEDTQEEMRQGKSFVKSLTDGEDINEFIYGGSLYRAKDNAFFEGVSVSEMIANDEWKLIREYLSTREKNETFYELYNIKNESLEEKDVYRENKDIADELERKIDYFREKYLVAENYDLTY